MAIAHNTTTSASNSFGSSVTFAHTTTGSDKLLAVGIHVRSDTVTISSVTHNGNALTLATGTNVVANSQTIAIYTMVAPDATGDVVVTLSSGTNVIAIANSYTGVNQSAPLGTSQTDSQLSGNTTSITLSSAADEMCIDIFGNRNGDIPTITGGQTLRGNVGSGDQINLATSEEVGAASTVMSWSIATSGVGRLQAGIPLLPAGGGAEILLVDSGTYNLSGTSIALKAEYSTAILSGSYSLSGTATGLIHDSKIISGSGTYSLTGSQVNLITARKIISDSGSYNLTGTNVTLVYTPNGGGEVLSIDSGAFSLSGSDIGLKAARLISLNNGDYNLAGQLVALTYNAKTIIDSGSYALTGSNVNLFANRVIIAQNGSYNLTGSVVTLKYSGEVTQTIGTVSSSFVADKYSTSFTTDKYLVSYKPTSIVVNFKE